MQVKLGKGPQRYACRAPCMQPPQLPEVCMPCALYAATTVIRAYACRAPCMQPPQLAERIKPTCVATSSLVRTCPPLPASCHDVPRQPWATHPCGNHSLVAALSYGAPSLWQQSPGATSCTVSCLWCLAYGNLPLWQTG